jgi:probable F420-dependent oxidoreductase
MELGRLGVWSGTLRYGPRGPAQEATAELEELGYSAAWLPGGAGGDIFNAVEALLEATTRIVVASGILNLWMHEPAETAARHAEITGTHPQRFLLGVGVSHRPLVDANDPGRYRQPLAAMRQYLDDLDAAVPPVPASERLLAALGPRMLELARDRSRGAHPYLVTPEHTHAARAVLGPTPLLAPEQAVVFSTDPTAAREIARAHLQIYLRLPNYVNNWRRFGFVDDDFQDGGSDRLADAIVAWGDEAAIVGRLRDHWDAGADHVCVQVLTSEPATLPLAEWRRLAAAL